MSSLRVSKTNLLALMTLKNGTGAPAPVLDEVAPFVTANLKRPDRTILYQQASGAGVKSIDYDALADVSVGLVGVMGQRAIPTGAGLDVFTLYYSTQANGYPPAGGPAWVQVPGCLNVTINGLRDAYFMFAAPIVARYWRFDHSALSTYTLGRHWLGVTDIDLGMLESDGVQNDGSTPVADNRSVGLNPIRTVQGDYRELVAIPFDDMTAAQLAVLRRIAKLTTTFVMFGRGDAGGEYLVQDAKLGVKTNYSGPNPLYSATLNLEQMA